MRKVVDQFIRCCSGGVGRWNALAVIFVAVKGIFDAVGADAVVEALLGTSSAARRWRGESRRGVHIHSEVSDAMNFYILPLPIPAMFLLNSF